MRACACLCERERKREELQCLTKEFYASTLQCLTQRWIVCVDNEPVCGKNQCPLQACNYSFSGREGNCRHYFRTAHVVGENIINRDTTVPHVTNTSYSLGTEILYCDQSFPINSIQCTILPSNNRQFTMHTHLLHT